MALYTFYCCKTDGSALTFEAYNLASDKAAVEHGEILLKNHRSCSHVIVTNGEKDIATVAREDRPLPAPVVPFEEPQLPQPVRSALDELGLQHPQVSLIATTPTGTVVYWNKAASRLYGWAGDGALGLNIMDVTPALQALGEAEMIMQKLRAGEAWDGEIVLRRRDGTPFRAYVVDVPVAGESGLIIGASAPASKRNLVRSLKPALVAQLGGH